MKYNSIPGVPNFVSEEFVQKNQTIVYASLLLMKAKEYMMS